MAKAYHRKIKFYWNLRLKKFGAEREFRTRTQLRDSITVLGHAGLKTAEK